MSQSQSPVNISLSSIPAELGRHPDFWFKDGSIVLIVQNTGFRIHQSILSIKSKVFASLFELHQPAGEPNIDGCPVAHLYDDSPQDIAEILNILYYGKHYDAQHNFPSWRIARAMLRIGSKYGMDDFREIALQNLERAFPQDIETWDKISQGSYLCMRLEPEDYISVANSSRKHDLPSHIRWQALYKCCQLSNSTLVQRTVSPDDSGEVFHLDDLTRCLCARKRFFQADIDHVVALIVPPNDCHSKSCITSQSTVQANLAHHAMTRGWISYHALAGEVVVSHTFRGSGICDGCTNIRMQIFNTKRQDILHTLSSFFEVD